MDIYKVPSCCSCHIMGYSYVYPPLKSASSKSEVVEPLPTSPPALPPRKPKPANSLIPKIDPPKEFQNFLENIGSSFNFAARSEKQSPAQVPCGPSMVDYPETSRNLWKTPETGGGGFRIILLKRFERKWYQ